jgi:alpha-ribazole phosphatase/probable phosphoglycerate mutase
VSRLILVRHAEPAPDVRGRCYGTLDVDLSARGREQAAALAQALRDEPIDLVVSSPRRRALETAAALGRPVEIDERLCELDFGDFEGRTYEELEREEPELFRRWMSAPTTVRFPSGESYADLRVRATAAFADLRARAERAVVVTHGGVIRAGLAAWLELPDRAVFRLDQRHCGVTVVEWLGDEPVVRMLNGSIASRCEAGGGRASGGVARRRG